MPAGKTFKDAAKAALRHDSALRGLEDLEELEAEFRKMVRVVD
jgi:hypothetical protein